MIVFAMNDTYRPKVYNWDTKKIQLLLKGESYCFPFIKNMLYYVYFIDFRRDYNGIYNITKRYDGSNEGKRQGA